MAKSKGKSLCKLVKDKILKKDLATYLVLVNDPKFVCKNCGRVANSKKNLCNPAKI